MKQVLSNFSMNWFVVAGGFSKGTFDDTSSLARMPDVLRDVEPSVTTVICCGLRVAG